jgi:hypothetical protein
VGAGVSEQSPELKAAYASLDEAIRTVVRLEEWTEGLVTDWVVMVANQYIDNDGRNVTQVGNLLPDGGNTIPHYRILGLLDYGATAARSAIAYATEDDEED